MKRVFALLLAILLGLSSFSALAEEEAKAAAVSSLMEMVREFLDHYEYTYTKKDTSFSLEFELNGVLKSCVVEVWVYYDAIYVSATPDLSVPNKNMESLAVAIALANPENFYSQFSIDFSENKFYARAVQLVEKTMPGFEELDVLFHQPMWDLEHYGDALYAVSQEGADPYDEIKKID